MTGRLEHFTRTRGHLKAMVEGVLSGLYAWTYSLYTRGIVKGLAGVSGRAEGQVGQSGG